jgi:hypothetical protein
MFDVIIGNPPYQEKKPGNKVSKKLWHLFVGRSLDLLRDEAYLCLVHPSGWRNAGGRWDKLRKKMLEKKFLYLDINDLEAGKKTFGAATRYDYYVIQNTQPVGETLINDQDNVIFSYNISNLDFIPNGKFDEIFALIADDLTSPVDLINDSSYHHTRDWMSKQKNTKNIYPCIQNIGKGDKITSMWWSSTNSRGHFGMPKVVFGRFGSNVFIDTKGEYGMCQDGTAIVDHVDNLPLIKEALQSKGFVDLMRYCDVGGSSTIYNRRIITLFSKDFWKRYNEGQKNE